MCILKGSSDLLSPIFNRKDKQIEVRKPMSLSERLRSEFGLDDSTDTDTDTENKHGKLLSICSILPLHPICSSEFISL